MLLGLLAAVFTFGACSSTTEEAEDLTVEEQAWQEIRDGALLVDVRTDEEFNDGHLDGAINIPYDVVGAHLDQFGYEKNRSIVLYCKSGRRAGLAQETLEGFGYTAVVNAGGYEDMLAVQ